MPQITYLVDHVTTTVDVAENTSVMHAAVQHDVGGIVAECGGNAMCATCHVYVVSGPVDALPAISVAEEEMLECTVSPRQATSRLSCQLTVVPALDGLVVRVAAEQT